MFDYNNDNPLKEANRKKHSFQPKNESDRYEKRKTKLKPVKKPKHKDLWMEEIDV